LNESGVGKVILEQLKNVLVLKFVFIKFRERERAVFLLLKGRMGKLQDQGSKLLLTGDASDFKHRYIKI